MAQAVQNDWFWNEVNGEFTESLDEKARAVIDNALAQRSDKAVADTKNTNGSDIRLSFLSHYLVIKFGREKRGKERLVVEREKHPVMTRENVMTLTVTWLIAMAGMYTLTSAAVYMLSYALQA